MKTWSLKESDLVALGQRYSEVEDDCNLQSMKPQSLCLGPLPRFSQTTCCLAEGTRSSVLITCMRLIPRVERTHSFFPFFSLPYTNKNSLGSTIKKPEDIINESDLEKGGLSKP